MKDYKKQRDILADYIRMLRRHRSFKEMTKKRQQVDQILSEIDKEDTNSNDSCKDSI